MKRILSLLLMASFCLPVVVAVTNVTAQEVVGQGFRENADDAFAKRLFRLQMRKMLRPRFGLTDEQKQHIRTVLADPDLVDAAYYGMKAQHVHDDEMVAFALEDGEPRFPIFEKIIDAIIANPDGFVEFLKKIIDLFIGVIASDDPGVSIAARLPQPIDTDTELQSPMRVPLEGFPYEWRTRDSYAVDVSKIPMGFAKVNVSDVGSLPHIHNSDGTAFVKLSDLKRLNVNQSHSHRSISTPYRRRTTTISRFNNIMFPSFMGEHRHER